MTIDDVKQVQRDLYLQLYLTRDVAPVREIARLDSQSSLTARIIAACRCSTPEIIAEIMQHPEIDRVAAQVEDARISRETMEAAARGMIAVAADLTQELRADDGDDRG